MSSNKFIFSDVIQRIKHREHISSDAKLAELLGLERTALAERKRRNSIPYKELVIYCEQNGVNMHYLLTGEGGEEFTPEDGNLPLESRGVQFHNIKEWLIEFWQNASEQERAWLYIELQRAFPEFKDWLKNREREINTDVS